MSWETARDTIETWLNGATIPFYNTINEEQEPVDDIWMTVMYGMGNGNITNYCRNRTESTNFNLVFYGNPGRGWRPLIQACETVRDYLMAQVDAAGKVEITDYGMPIEFTYGDGVPWFGIELVFDIEIKP